MIWEIGKRSLANRLVEILDDDTPFTARQNT